MKTTVVIPNYNGKKYLAACLKSLEESEKERPCAVVVDNGSTDGSDREAEERFPWVRLIRFPENRGFDAAVNEGIRQSRTPYVFLLNNDTIVRPGCISVLEARMEREEELFSLSARMVDMRDPTVMDGAGDLYSALGWAYAVGKGKPAARYGRPVRIFSACAGAAIYRRSMLERTGLFDELHFAYLEDVDLGYRARILGFVNAYEPSAVVLHAGSATSGSRYNEFKIRYSARNNVYLIYKNMPALQILLNSPFLLAGFAVKFLFFLKKGYGRIYAQGFREGFALCASPEGRAGRVRFKGSNLGNYIRIQAQLWINVLRAILNKI